MLLRCPINTCEPFSLFMHHALSAYWPHGARKQFEPRRNPSLCLYWRSHAHLPTGRRSRPFHRGTSPLQALTNKTGRWRSMVAPGESARSRKIAAVRDLRGHAALPSYVPRERHTGSQGMAERRWTNADIKRTSALAKELLTRLRLRPTRCIVVAGTGIE